MLGPTLNLVHVTLTLLLIEFAVSYKNYTLDSPHVCSPNTKKRLKLGILDTSSIVITQNLLSGHSLEWKVDARCKFEVRTDNGGDQRDGVYVVIHKLDLRRNKQTGECVDYVQFKRKDGLTSRRFCGTIRSRDVMTIEDEYEESSEVRNDLSSVNTFVDPKGEIDVYVFVAKEALKVYDEKTDIVIVFTAFRSCNQMKGAGRPCLPDNPTDCIYAGFFDDGIVNCPYMGCTDEHGCVIDEDEYFSRRDSIGNKVLIGSVSSLLLTFGLFICCIYICKKYGALCWSEEFSRPAPSTVVVSPQGQRGGEPCSPESTTSGTASGSNFEATAPPPPEKDLPPSYESLFPTR